MTKPIVTAGLCLLFAVICALGCGCGGRDAVTQEEYAGNDQHGAINDAEAGHDESGEVDDHGAEEGVLAEGDVQDHGSEGDVHEEDAEDQHNSDGDVSDEHAGHDHGEGSDLDRSPEDLFAARCEHGVFTYQCEECRYEVGVVRVPADLTDGGLVETTPVVHRSFGADAELTGEISFDERRIAHLSPLFPGIVQHVFVDLGQSVASESPLIEIDSPELAEAQADYLGAMAEHRLAKRNFDRQTELREAGISSEREFFEASQSLETAEIHSNSGRQRLLRLGITGGEISGLESTGIAGATGRYILKAPFSGEVLELHAVRGEQVELDRELALFGSTQTLWVWVDLYETYLDAVASAQLERAIMAAVSVQAYPGETFEGRVDFIGSTMSEDTRTVKARITLENEAGKLRPGMFAAVNLLLDDREDGLSVPSSSVLSDEGLDFVFVYYLDDYFLRRQVRTGRTSGEFVEIIDGLAPGQTVAASGAFLLKSDVLRSKMGEGCAH
jgi:cobalt-zinc-cadmium efflux system membrane fusion protein